METCAVVVAAGTGSRFGARKQFAPLRGARVVDHAVAAAAVACDGVVVVLPDDHGWSGPAVDAAVVGGASRSESVRRGLDAVPDTCEVVVVHDGARPLATAGLFSSVVEAVVGGAAGAAPGVAVSDTLKRVDGDLVVETVPRHGLVGVQTPQAFRADVLRRAHAAGGDAGDDAALVEALGERVVVVPGEARNLKLTTAVDLEVAECLAGGETR